MSRRAAGEWAMRAAAVGLALALAWTAVQAGLAWAQPGGDRARNLAPNPDVRSVVIEAAAAGDSADVTVTWTPAVVRPSGATPELHRLTVFDADTVRFLATDSVTAAEHDGSATMAQTVRVPADTVAVPSEACVQAFHRGLQSAERCTSFTMPERLRLTDPSEPDVQVEIDSLVVVPDSVLLAVGDSIQLSAWLYSGGVVVGCSGACLNVTTEIQPAALAMGAEWWLRVGERVNTVGEAERRWVIEAKDVQMHNRRVPLLAAMWRHGIGLQGG